MTIDPADITFCVKTFNRPRLLFRCLRSLRYFSPESRIVVCDDSTIEHDYPAALREHIQLIRTEPNIGLSAGRNRCVAVAETPFCFVLDDDHGLQKRSHWRESLTRLPAFWLDGITAWPLHRVGSRAKGGYELLVCPSPASLTGLPQTVIVAPLRADSQRKCDLVVNNFLARTELLRRHPWPDRFKTREHFPWAWGFLRQPQRPEFHVMPRQYSWLHMQDDSVTTQQLADYQTWRTQGNAELARYLSEHHIDRVIWTQQVSVDYAES